MVTKENFYIRTNATWQKIKHGNHAQLLFDELNSRKDLEIIRPCGSSSVYIIDGDEVYRFSDHWGRVASCFWDLNEPIPRWLIGHYIIAKANFSDFLQKL